jgi:hypothetical protein
MLDIKSHGFQRQSRFLGVTPENVCASPSIPLPAPTSNTERSEIRLDDLLIYGLGLGPDTFLSLA